MLFQEEIQDDKLGQQTFPKDDFTSSEGIIADNKLQRKRVEISRLKKLDDDIRRKFNHPNLIHWICLILLAGSLWGTMFSVTRDFTPGSQIFGMFALFVLSYVAGEVTRLIRLPPLLGMLLMGLLLRNLGVINFTGIYVRITSVLREVSLFVILTRAGMGLDPKALKNLSLLIIRLAFCPALLEGTISMILAHYLLNLPWLWGALLGSILAAVSPAVVIPCLFALQEKGYGTEKGVPTLIVAAASLDDILSISIFGVLISMIFSAGSSLTLQILKGPIGVLIGVIFGIVWGVLLQYIPHKEDKNLVMLRALMLVGGGLMIIFGSELIGYPGAGPLGCIVAPFVASLGWQNDGWEIGNNPVTEVFSVTWLIFQPILFGLIGAEVDVTVLEGTTVAYGILALICSLFARILVSMFIAFGGGLDWKEKIFVAWAWFPKATVQAALGPLPLDKVRESGSEEETEFAQKTLIVAVLAIIITAPIGAILITLLGPKLLKKNVDIGMNKISERKFDDNLGTEYNAD